ncbi:MAG: hypothetical protein Ct9H90mP20_6700 [Candidatus Neomarinimicrobiota bacterium]|nr:MAG: hypothetical protein Ct9H90mP20_6700 [Candidatus Neomarinimicrobiota bacterium]
MIREYCSQQFEMLLMKHLVLPLLSNLDYIFFLIKFKFKNIRSSIVLIISGKLSLTNLKKSFNISGMKFHKISYW